MSLLAKKIANLEEYRVKVKELEKEIGEMLGLVVPTRHYTKRAIGPIMQARLDAAGDDEAKAPPKPKRRAWNSPSEATKAEALRRLHGDELAAVIVKSLHLSMRALREIATGAGINLRRRGRQIGQASQSGATADQLEKRIVALREQGKGHKEIILAVHKTSKFVREILKKHGMNGRITERQRALVLQLHAENKMMLKDIAAKAGLSKSATSAIIKKGPAQR